MANQVTYENLFSESRNNVVALVTSSNVPDPTLSSAEYRKWIYSREPDAKSSEFTGYPYIIIHPCDLDIERERSSVDGRSKFVNWDIEIEIVTSDRGYGEGDGQGLTNMDTISNSIIKTFMNITNRNTLSTNSMKFVNPTTTAVGTEVMENELVYRRSVIISFSSRIQVSA